MSNIAIGTKVSFRCTSSDELDNMTGVVVGYYNVHASGRIGSYIVLFDNDKLYNDQRAIVIGIGCVKEIIK